MNLPLQFSATGSVAAVPSSCLPALSDFMKFCYLQTEIVSQVINPTLDNEANYVTWSVLFQWWHLFVLSSSWGRRVGENPGVQRVRLPGIKGSVLQSYCMVVNA